MDNNFFALISRMRYIERWSLMRNSIHENIQEHSHMVAVIAHALGVIRRDVFGVACDADACATVALYHDASEILTGDLPTPIKYHDGEIMSAYIKCIEERKAGNNEFASAEKQTLEALHGYNMPEVEYFIEHFIPAFEKTLDELGSID